MEGMALTPEELPERLVAAVVVVADADADADAAAAAAADGAKTVHSPAVNSW